MLWFRAKTYSYLIDDDGEEDKKPKGTKICVIKQKLKIGYYKNCRETTQFKKKKHLLKNEIDVDSHRNNKLILKTQKRLQSERNRNNAFTEEINKIDLSSNDDTRMQSINSIETYP